jgi:hypothetical protein
MNVIVLKMQVNTYKVYILPRNPEKSDLDRLRSLILNKTKCDNIVQFIGDIVPFSTEGTQAAVRFIRNCSIIDNAAILYSFLGSMTDYKCDTNAVVNQYMLKYPNSVPRIFAHTVDQSSVLSNSRVCDFNLRNYIITQDKISPTEIGDDMNMCVGISRPEDYCFLLDGGVYSLYKCSEILKMGVRIIGIKGLREKQYKGTFSAAKYLHLIKNTSPRKLLAKLEYYIKTHTIHIPEDLDPFRRDILFSKAIENINLLLSTNIHSQINIFDISDIIKI